MVCNCWFMQKEMNAPCTFESSLDHNASNVIIGWKIAALPKAIPTSQGMDISQPSGWNLCTAFFEACLGILIINPSAACHVCLFTLTCSAKRTPCPTGSLLKSCVIKGAIGCLEPFIIRWYLLGRGVRIALVRRMMTLFPKGKITQSQDDEFRNFGSRGLRDILHAQLDRYSCMNWHVKQIAVCSKPKDQRSHIVEERTVAGQCSSR